MNEHIWAFARICNWVSYLSCVLTALFFQCARSIYLCPTRLGTVGFWWNRCMQAQSSKTWSACLWFRWCSWYYIVLTARIQSLVMLRHADEKTSLAWIWPTRTTQTTVSFSANSAMEITTVWPAPTKEMNLQAWIVSVACMSHAHTSVDINMALFSSFNRCRRLWGPSDVSV